MVPLGHIPFAFPGLPGVFCAFSLRTGGASLGPFAGANMSFDVGDAPEHVAQNRLALAEDLGIFAWRECRQVHGDILHHDPDPQAPDRQNHADEELVGDGLSTARPGLALGIKTADCQPVLLAHRSGGFVAALHVGWRGNVLDFAGSAVARLCERYGAEPADLFAVRGPSLGPQAAQFTHFDAEFGPDFRPFFDAASQTVDLWSLTRHQLHRAGLPQSQIFGLDLCTLTNTAAFFSYRANRVTGRQLSLIWLRG